MLMDVKGPLKVLGVFAMWGLFGDMLKTIGILGLMFSSSCAFIGHYESPE